MKPANHKNGSIKINPFLSRYATELRAWIGNTPVLGPAAHAFAKTAFGRWLRRGLSYLTFRRSSSFWERRYGKGGSSGSGSYGRLAAFKAEILNDLVARRAIQSVVEFGCGDGAQLARAQYPRYVGIDVAQGAVALCRERFAHDPTKQFYLASELPADLGCFDLALSLDVIYHLVEDAVFDAYMRSLFAHAQKAVVIYSSNKTEPSGVPHVRHRRFTDWVQLHAPEWRKVGYVANRYPFEPARSWETSFADFYIFERESATVNHD
ncbi:MAG TPA: class I SAM-dependent methyltransferase [Chthoniobacterales bacterium]